MPSNNKELDMLCTMDERYAGAEALARCERQEVGWCAPEVLRARGENLLNTEGADPAMSAALYEQSWDMAAAQQALAWQLRTACSLSRLALAVGGQENRAGEFERLHSTYLRFTDGRDTADLVEARRLLSTFTAT